MNLLDKLAHGDEYHLQAAEEIARLTAELEAVKAALHGPIAEVGPEEMAAIIAHLSPELEPRSPLPNSNSLMMAIIREKARADKAEAMLSRAYEACRDDAAATVEGLWAFRTCQEVTDAIRDLPVPDDLMARLGGGA